MMTVLGFFLLWAVMLSASFALGRADLPEVIWGEKIAVASAGGYRGPWRMNESEYDYVDDPTVAINEQGLVAVVWADQTRKDLFFQLYAPNGETRLEKPVNVSRSPRIFSWLPRMLITSTDPIEVYLLWQEIVFSGGSHGGEIVSRAVERWRQDVERAAQSLERHRWFRQRTYYPGLLAQREPGPRHGRRRQSLCRLDRLRRGPVVQPFHGSGRQLLSPVARRRRRKTHAGPLSGRRRPGRRLSGLDRGRRQSREPPFCQVDRSGPVVRRAADRRRGQGHTDAPKLAVDRQGTVHLVYAESLGGPFERYVIQYTRSHDRGDSFEAPKEIARPHTEQFASVHFPALSVDGQDNLYIIWELFPRRGSAAQGLGFTVSRDAGRTFAPPVVVPGSVDPALGFNGSQQGLLMRKLAVNQAGAIAVVNSTFKRNEQSRVWLWRGQRNKVPEPLAR